MLEYAMQCTIGATLPCTVQHPAWDLSPQKEKRDLCHKRIPAAARVWLSFSVRCQTHPCVLCSEKGWIPQHSAAQKRNETKRDGKASKQANRIRDYTPP